MEERKPIDPGQTVLECTCLPDLYCLTFLVRMVGFALTFIPTCLVCYVHCNEADRGCQTFFNSYSECMLNDLFFTNNHIFHLYKDMNSS